MKIIDSHLHFSKIESFKRTAAEISFLDYSSSGLKAEYEKCNIIAGIAMGLTEKALGGFPDYQSENPMGLDLEEKVPDNILCCLGINPMKLYGEEKHFELEKIENELRKSYVAGIKIYAGYYPFYVFDKVYHPVYKLAEKYDMPVVIHSGDTYSERGLLKYSHPLNIDELAVMFRKVKFVIAHMGDPWIMETAEIIRKNYNLYADMSGFLVGDGKHIERFKQEQLFKDHFRRGLIYADMYDRFLFGTDWPLVQVEPYINFIQTLIPDKFQEKVFFKNAIEVFTKLKDIV